MYFTTNYSNVRDWSAIKLEGYNISTKERITTGDNIREVYLVNANVGNGVDLSIFNIKEYLVAIGQSRSRSPRITGIWVYRQGEGGVLSRVEVYTVTSNNPAYDTDQQYIFSSTHNVLWSDQSTESINRFDAFDVTPLVISRPASPAVPAKDPYPIYNICKRIWSIPDVKEADRPIKVHKNTDATEVPIDLRPKYSS